MPLNIFCQPVLSRDEVKAQVSCGGIKSQNDVPCLQEKNILGGSRNVFPGIRTSKTLGSGSPTLLCLLCALIGGFRPKHPLMDLSCWGGAGRSPAWKSAPGDSRHCCWESSLLLGLVSFAFCVLQKDERVWGTG